MNKKKEGNAIPFGAAKGVPEVGVKEAPVAEVSPQEEVIYALDSSAIKTIEDVAVILDGLHIGMASQYYDSLPENVQKLFRKEVRVKPQQNNQN